MKVSELTENKLVLVDSQLDKKIAIAVMSVILLYFGYEFSVTNDWLITGILVLVAIGSWLFLWLTHNTSVFTFDRNDDKVTLVTKNRRGTQQWDWKLSDIKTTTVSTITQATTDPVKSTAKLPVFVLKDGTRVPMRPYHSAGGQSWKSIEAIRKFIGDDNRDDFPVGYIFDD